MGGKEDLGPEEIVGVEGTYNSENTSWGYFFHWEVEKEDMLYEMRFETGEQNTCGKRGVILCLIGIGADCERERDLRRFDFSTQSPIKVLELRRDVPADVTMLRILGSSKIFLVLR